MVKIFYTSPSYRNITESLFKEALTYLKGTSLQSQARYKYPDYSKVLYLAPSYAKVREAQMIFHKLMEMEFGGSRGNEVPTRICYIPPEMATISGFSKKVYSIYGDRRLLQRSLIPAVFSRLSERGLGFSSLLSDLISDTKRYFPEKSIDEIRDVFLHIFNECNIPVSVAKLPLDCLEAWNKYQIFMEENGLVDEDDVLNAFPRYVTNKLKGTGEKYYSLLIVDGFYDPNISEKNILRSLIQNSGITIIAVPYLNNSDITDSYIQFIKHNFNIDGAQEIESDTKVRESNLTYSNYPDPETEVEGIARNIKSLYVSGKFRELERIVVAFPVLDKYSSMIERVFKRYGIPFEIPRRKPLGKRKPFLDLISLLHSVAEGYPRLRFAQFLSSRYFRKIPNSLRQWIHLLSLQSGIVSGKESWLNLVAKGSETFDITLIQREDIEKGLKWVFKRLKTLEDNRMSASIDIYAKALKKIVDELGFLETSHDSTEGDETVDLVQDEKKKFHEVLEQVSIFGSLYPYSIGLTEFIEVFSHLLNASFLEEEGRGVKVLDFSEVMGLSAEYLYLGGLSDDAMPRKQDLDYFLPDSVKKRLGFMYLDRYIDIQRFIFTFIVNSSGQLHLSYPLTDGDTQYLPSSFLYHAGGVKERIPGIFSKEEYLIMKGRSPLSSHISEIGIRDIRFQPYLRVTDIDAYRFCPRKFYIERIAKVLPLEVKEYEVEAITLGNILHKIMEKIVLEPLKDLDSLRERAIEIADEVIGEKKIDAYWKGLIRDTFLSILPDIYDMELEIRREGYITSVVEKTIIGEPVKGIKLKGNVDRFDRIGDTVQIIDYKSGAAGLNCAQVAKGNENLQLFLYAAIMKNQGYTVDRVGIYSLKDIQIKWCPPQKKGKGKEKENIDDYIVASLKYLEEAVREIRAGDFTARPLDEYNCRNCHEYSLCPYIQQ